MRTLSSAALAALTLSALPPLPQAWAQTPPPGINRQVLQKAELATRSGAQEAVVARVEVAPGAQAGRHTHPGEEISYVLEGEGWLLIDGQEPKRVKAGESFIVPAGVVHDAKNDGPQVMKVLGVYVLEKGKPLASPAAANTTQNGK